MSRVALKLNSVSPPDEPVELNMRDMISLLALPALWAGRDGAVIVELMTESVARLVPLDICYVDVPLLPGVPPFVRMRRFGVGIGGGAQDDTPMWQPTVDAWHRVPVGSGVFVSDTPVGPKRMVRLSLGFSSGRGSVWFGASAPTFPTVHEMALLRAATSLAAAGIFAARASHEREEATRAKDEFLAMLGHELRNPLAPITTALGLIRRESGSSLSKYHEIIERQVAHLSRLVEDLLDVSRIARGKIVLQREVLRLGAVITRAVESASPLIEQREQRLSVKISEDGAKIFADPTRLTQAFSNLLNNAAKYTGVGGLIQLDASVTDMGVTVSVADNGVGITPELMPKLFSLFEQGHTTIDRSEGGLGIGLALVKTLIELHDGQVSARSDGPGKGATFTVSLPLATAAEIARSITQATIVAPQPAQGAGARVLLVDDNADGLLAMEAFLTEFGFHVAAAMDPVQALDIAASFAPHIAILDIGLPGMNGYELAVALRKQPQHADLRLFALTGYSQDDDVRQATAAGFERHFVKPVVLFDLVTALNAV